MSTQRKYWRAIYGIAQNEWRVVFALPESEGQEEANAMAQAIEAEGLPPFQNVREIGVEDITYTD